MSIFRRRLMIANALKRSDGNINYPGLVAAWDIEKEGKNNQHPDREWARDLTGNGHDIQWMNIAYNEEGSGYKDGAMYLDGIDDYGINEDMPILTDYTIILKRVIDKNHSNPVAAFISKREYDELNGAFWFERLYENWSFGARNSIKLNKDLSVSWLTKNSYNGNSIDSGTELDTDKIVIGKVYANRGGSQMKGAFYSAYLFNRSLNELEIKAFIRKYIDPEYILPSEQTIT